MTRRLYTLSIIGLFLGLICPRVFPQANVETADSDDDPKRTTWGVPNIEGVWDFRNLTPLERPAEFADKAVLTPEEARAYTDTIRP